MFVYLITNTINGKYYVGKWAGSHVFDRWHGHIAETNRGSHTVFHNAIRKYGPEKFSVSILTSAKSVEEISNLERLWIWALQATNRAVGYNLSAGGDGASYPRSAETKARMSRAVRERLSTVEGRRKMLAAVAKAALAPKNFSKESRNRIGANTVLTHTGKKRSTESCERMRVSRLRYFQTPNGLAEKKKLSRNKGNGNLIGGC